MFHWICPECGREIAPTVRECSVCDPKAALAEPAHVGVVEAPARALSMEVAARTLDSAATPFLAPALAAEPLPSWDYSELPAARSPFPDLEPIASPATLPEFFHAGQAAQDGLTAILEWIDDGEPVRADPPSWDRIPVPVAAIPSAMQALIQELRPANNARASQPELIENSHEKTELEPPLIDSLEPLFGAVARPSSPGQFPSQSMRPSPQPSALPAAASVPLRPATPRLELAPAMAPLANYSPLAGRPMQPARPAPGLMKAGCSARITLPGPMLTPKLVSFQDKQLNPIFAEARAFKKPLVPGWAITLLILVTVLGAGFASVFTIVPRSAESRVTPPTTQETAAAPAVTRAGDSSSLSESIEVTGFRIVVDPARKSEIHYLVVNHLPTVFSDVTVYVTLRLPDAKPGQPPLSRFSFAAPRLGPFEAKEMISSIEKLNRSVTLPNWQDLRAEIQIGQ